MNMAIRGIIWAVLGILIVVALLSVFFFPSVQVFILSLVLILGGFAVILLAPKSPYTLPAGIGVLALGVLLFLLAHANSGGLGF